jgi:hypothetical protein
MAHISYLDGMSGAGKGEDSFAKELPQQKQAQATVKGVDTTKPHDSQQGG